MKALAVYRQIIYDSYRKCTVLTPSNTRAKQTPSPGMYWPPPFCSSLFATSANIILWGGLGSKHQLTYSFFACGRSHTHGLSCFCFVVSVSPDRQPLVFLLQRKSSGLWTWSEQRSQMSVLCTRKDETDSELLVTRSEELKKSFAGQRFVYTFAGLLSVQRVIPLHTYTRGLTSTATSYG